MTVLRRWARRSGWSATVYGGQWQWQGWRWFGIASPALALSKAGRLVFVILLELFNRHSTQGHFWGVVIGKVGRRALFGVTHDGVSIGYIGRLQ